MNAFGFLLAAVHARPNCPHSCMEWGLGGIGHGQSRLRGLLPAPLGRDTDAIYGGQSCPRRKWGKEEERRATGQGGEDYHEPVLG